LWVCLFPFLHRLRVVWVKAHLDPQQPLPGHMTIDQVAGNAQADRLANAGRLMHTEMFDKTEFRVMHQEYQTLATQAVQTQVAMHRLRMHSPHLFEHPHWNRFAPTPLPPRTRRAGTDHQLARFYAHIFCLDCGRTTSAFAPYRTQRRLLSQPCSPLKPYQKWLDNHHKPAPILVRTTKWQATWTCEVCAQNAQVMSRVTCGDSCKVPPSKRRIPALNFTYAQGQRLKVSRRVSLKTPSFQVLRIPDLLQTSALE
jgi:hypothetical protein